MHFVYDKIINSLGILKSHLLRIMFENTRKTTILSYDFLRHFLTTKDSVLLIIIIEKISGKTSKL